MLKRLFWNFFPLLSVIVTLFIAKNFFSKIMYYQSLSQQAPALIESWSAEDKKAKYRLLAHYSFQLRSVHFKGKTSFSLPIYKNNYNFEDTAKELSQKEWQVFYNPLNPIENSLEKRFPFEETLRLILLLALSCHLFVLKNLLLKPRI